MVEGICTGTSVSYNSSGALVDQLMTRADPQLIAFGEIHKYGFEKFKSTLEYFAEEIMPILAKHGVTDLVVEFLGSDPVIEMELEQFCNNDYKFDEKTKNLEKFLRPDDLDGFVKVIKTARKLGIKLHGSNLSEKEVRKYYDNAGDKTGDRNLRKRVRQLIKEHSQEKAEALLAQGKKVAMVNGIIHNDISLTPGLQGEDSSYGAYFAKKLGSRYIEVDLFIPKLFQYSLDEYPAYSAYQNTFSNEGVRCDQPESNRFLIFYQTTNLE